eukprot:CAMPEP_0197013338 /NCGR_PEP_ID=MMETSP1380-20130617/65969_1 /TAXON_ID=5936 /ORGANISM="Euplotes crassus, Strain CT5" /LENGTH=190 /DNA_ID=CAMNT_0042437503 /DNA_START=97 /DNA_END=670 /DNA_ORIENTATION=-
MTNLYESLGVGRKASQKEIEEAYLSLKKVFTDDTMDSMAQSMMADAKMALNDFQILKNREEYDEYLSSHLKVAGYQRRFANDFSESDTEEEERTKKRDKDRGKRRFEEQDQFFNEKFMNGYNSRRRKAQEEEFHQSIKNFTSKGEDVKVEITIDFKESVRGTTKGLMIDKDVKCHTCKGTRAAKDTEVSI